MGLAVSFCGLIGIGAMRSVDLVRLFKRSSERMSPEERVKILRDAPPKTWIAFSQDESKVVANGQTYEEAASRAELEGESDPVLVMIPASWLPRVL